MRQSGEAVDREHLYQGVQPASGYLRENFPRWACDTDLDPLTGGVMLSAAVWCQAGDEIRSITFQGGATAANEGPRLEPDTTAPAAAAPAGVASAGGD